jgi:CBS domain-containing protein
VGHDRDTRKEDSMKVEDIMTRDVLTVEPDTPIREVARILAENHISGVPVCNPQGEVLGVVSEGDILFKEYDPIPARTSRLFSLLSESSAASATSKSRAVNAGEAMTSPPITLPAYCSVAEAARLMSEHGVNRLPVLGAQKLVGIVTRSDLLQAFVREDDDIRREIEEDVLRRNLWLEDPGAVIVEVERGAVRVTGRVATRSEAAALERLAARVPGVVSVQSELSWTTDDSTRKANREVRSTREPAAMP